MDMLNMWVSEGVMDSAVPGHNKLLLILLGVYLLVCLGIHLVQTFIVIIYSILLLQIFHLTLQ